VDGDFGGENRPHVVPELHELRGPLVFLGVPKGVVRDVHLGGLRPGPPCRDGPPGEEGEKEEGEKQNHRGRRRWGGEAQAHFGSSV